MSVEKADAYSGSNSLEYSISPAGERFPLPQRQQYKEELRHLEERVDQARKEGKEIVVVMGIGL